MVNVLKNKQKGAPDGPVIRIQGFHCCGLQFHPRLKNQDSAKHMVWQKKKKVNK